MIDFVAQITLFTRKEYKLKYWPIVPHPLHESSLIKLTGHLEKLHRLNELKLGPSSTLRDSSAALSQLQKLIVLYVLSNSGHWHQRFERALSWDRVRWCNLWGQKFNMSLIPVTLPLLITSVKGNKKLLFLNRTFKSLIISSLKLLLQLIDTLVRLYEKY